MGCINCLKMVGLWHWVYHIVFGRFICMCISIYTCVINYIHQISWYILYNHTIHVYICYNIYYFTLWCTSYMLCIHIYMFSLYIIATIYKSFIHTYIYIYVCIHILTHTYVCIHMYTYIYIYYKDTVHLVTISARWSPPALKTCWHPWPVSNGSLWWRTPTGRFFAGDAPKGDGWSVFKSHD